MADNLTFEVDISGIKELIAKLSEATKPEVLSSSLDRSGWKIVNWIQGKRFVNQSKKSPALSDILTNRSFRLSGSLTAQKGESSGGVYTEKIGTNVVYGPIHEFGGSYHRASSMRKTFEKIKIKEWISKPGSLVAIQRSRTIKLRKSDRFVVGGIVNVPARPFLRPALEDEGNRQMVLDNLTKDINEALKK